jgi:hypothetical protein
LPKPEGSFKIRAIIAPPTYRQDKD